MFKTLLIVSACKANETCMQYSRDREKNLSKMHYVFIFKKTIFGLGMYFQKLRKAIFRLKINLLKI